MLILGHKYNIDYYEKNIGFGFGYHVHWFRISK